MSSEKGTLEYRKEQQRLWRLANKDKVLENARNYRKTHREEINAKRRTEEYHQKQRDYVARRMLDPNYVKPKHVNKLRTREEKDAFNLYRNNRYKNDPEYRARVKYLAYIKREIAYSLKPHPPPPTPEQIAENIKNKRVQRILKQREYRIKNHDAIKARAKAKNTPEVLAVVNSLRRERYKNDPDYRKKILSKTTNWNKIRYDSDPEYRKLVQEKQIAYNKAHPEITAKSQARAKLKYQTNEIFRKKKNAYFKEYRDRKKLQRDLDILNEKL